VRGMARALRCGLPTLPATDRAPAFVPKPNCHLPDGAPSPCVTLTAPLVKSAVDSVHNLGARRYGRTGVVTKATVKAQAGLPAHGLL
jgi:hypothetical protein